MDENLPAVKIEYNGNVLRSESRRTADANLTIALRALDLLLDLPPDTMTVSLVEREGGTVTYYKSY